MTSQLDSKVERLTPYSAYFHELSEIPCIFDGLKTSRKTSRSDAALEGEDLDDELFEEELLDDL